MSKFFVQGSNNEVGYEIYENRTDRKPVDLRELHKPYDSILRCIAFLNYLIAFNNQQPEFYKRETAVVVAECIKIFKGNSKCSKDNILKYFGVDPEKVYEYKAITNLTRDICKDIEADRHIVTAAKFIVNLRNEEESKVN